MIEVEKENGATAQVGNLKALKNETSIPLVQLLDSPITIIPGEPTNRVSCNHLHFASVLDSRELLCMCIIFLLQTQCCAVLLQTCLCAVFLQSHCCAVLCCAVLCCAVLCCAVLCCATAHSVLFGAVLCYCTASSVWLCDPADIWQLDNRGWLE